MMETYRTEPFPNGSFVTYHSVASGRVLGKVVGSHADYNGTQVYEIRTTAKRGAYNRGETFYANALHLTTRTRA
jgi:hypothetical protein